MRFRDNDCRNTCLNKIILHGFSIFILTLLFYPYSLFGQDSSVVEYKSLGIRFSIPQNWEGKETKGMYLLTSENNEGIVMLRTFPLADIQSLKTQFSEGLEVESGFFLAPTEPIQTVNNHRLQGKFSGLINFTPVVAYLVLLKGEQQQTVLIISANDKEKYTFEQESIAMEIAEGFEFYKPVMPSLSDEYTGLLSDTWLIYTSSAGSHGFDSENQLNENNYGYREKTTILLCRQGFFSYNNFTSGNGSVAVASGNNTFTGQWNIVKDVDNHTVLRLLFDDGDRLDFEIDYLEGQIYLNEDQYIRSPLTIIEKEDCN
jgi:hypothetical protein